MAEIGQGTLSSEQPAVLKKVATRVLGARGIAPQGFAVGGRSEAKSPSWWPNKDRVNEPILNQMANPLDKPKQGRAQGLS